MKHLARLRSWRESRRTGLFCTVYFIAWASDALSSLLLISLTALILSSKIRSLLFPPAPLALVDLSSGGVAKPQAGVLGSTDSATGAPETHKGEALENEASNFVTGVAAIAMNVLVEKDPEGEPEPEDNVSIPEPNSLAGKVATVKDKAAGVDKPSQDKTKLPVETAMWTKLRPIMHMICVVSDTWERFANLLVPTLPFNQQMYQSRLGTLLIPLLAASRCMTAYMVFKGTTFIAGLALFGDPLLTRVYNYLNHYLPQWHNLLRLDNTLLKDVPTNAQLAITLLRLGEINKAPIPPPPCSRKSPSQHPIELDKKVLNASVWDKPLNATEEKLHEAISYDPGMVKEAGGHDAELTKPTEHGRKRTKVFGVVKGSAKMVAEAAIGANKLKATIGSATAKSRVGVVPHWDKPSIASPVKFTARYNGKKGCVYVITEAASPCITFVKDSMKEKTAAASSEEPDLNWTISIADIKELQKNPGLGFKSKMMMGWALEREIKDGIEIIDRHDTSRVLTAVSYRDALFNRLSAIGVPKWESW